MTAREQYTPGPASGAQVLKDGEKWTLVLVRNLRHSPAKVWQALTDPAQLREWAPFDADRNLGTAGAMKCPVANPPAIRTGAIPLWESATCGGTEDLDPHAGS